MANSNEAEGNIGENMAAAMAMAIENVALVENGNVGCIMKS